jgi:DNA-binding Xre family transcriptional regulator
MLHLNLTTIIENRGIENPNQFLIKSGFTYYTASRMLNEARSKISFSHLEKLCIALNCSVEDLIVWEPPKGMKDIDKHPLAKLRPRKQKGNITSTIKNLPPEKLNALRDYIEKLQNSEPQG